MWYITPFLYKSEHGFGTEKNTEMTLNCNIFIYCVILKPRWAGQAHGNKHGNEWQFPNEPLMQSSKVI